MTGAQSIVVQTAVVLAVALAGVGLYAHGQDECARYAWTKPSPPPPATLVDGITAEPQPLPRSELYCAQRAAVPFTEQAATRWWAAAGAVLLVGAAAVLLVRRS